jgi:hypothetical protein
MRWGEGEMIRGSEGQEGHTSDEPGCCLSLWSQGWRWLAASRAPSHWTATKGRCWVEVARAAPFAGHPRQPLADITRLAPGGARPRQPPVPCVRWQDWLTPGLDYVLGTEILGMVSFI